jgi:hypothetical protein
MRKWFAAWLASGVLTTLAPPVRAADPPGFPSTGALPTTQPSQPSVGDFARERIAAIAKFVRDKEEDPAFAEREGAHGICRVDRARRVLVLTFNADGTLHCKAPPVAEGYQLEVNVLTVKSLYASGNHYRVSAKPGAPLKAVSVHGTAEDVKAAVTAMAGLREDYTTAAWWQAPRLLGPFHNEDVTLTVALDEAGVREDTVLAITPLSTFNLGVVALVGRGTTTYSVVDGTINEHVASTDLSYYFGVHVYPLSWSRNGQKRLRPGRYFAPEYVTLADHVSVLAGIDLAHPREGAYLGVALELYGGISLTAGWQPRKLAHLQAGSAAGDPITGDAVPTDASWKVDRWGVGLSVDASLLKPIVSYLVK